MLDDYEQRVFGGFGRLNINPIADLILKIDDDLLYEDHLENLETQIQKLLKKHPDIDGIFAVNELYAVVAMKVARELDIEIPNKLQVIGFTDGMLSKHATSALYSESAWKAMGEKTQNYSFVELMNVWRIVQFNP